MPGCAQAGHSPGCKSDITRLVDVIDLRKRKASSSKMLANAPDVSGYTRTNRPSRRSARRPMSRMWSLGLPVRRVGLEQEFFLVDRKGALSDLADPFLRRCQDARGRRARSALFQGRVREESSGGSHTAKLRSQGSGR